MKYHHIGLYGIIGVLIAVSIAIGFNFLIQEEKWKNKEEELQSQIDQLEIRNTELVALDEQYQGPYGVWSYIQAGGVEPVPRFEIDSEIQEWEQVRCQMTREDEEPIWSANFNPLEYINESSSLYTDDEEEAERIKNVFNDSLRAQGVTATAEDQERSLYAIHQICEFSDSQLLLIATDSQNDTIRFPILAEVEGSEWTFIRFDPTRLSFGASQEGVSVFRHRNGSPVLLDTLRNGRIIAWEAYHLDRQSRASDLIESCRINTGGSEMQKSCTRIYEEQ